MRAEPETTQPAAGRAGERRWTVLFIGDHGRVIPFRRVKTVGVLLAATFATALAAVAVLVWVNHELHARTRVQLERMEAARKEIEELRRDRDLLTAQVVLLETRMREASTPRPPASERRLEPPPTVPEPVAAASGEPAEDTLVSRPPIHPGEGVALDGVRLSLTAAGAIELRYRIVAVGQPRKPFNGHVVAVLKAEDLDPERWLSLPRLELVNGRPTGRQKGYTFAVSHAKEFAQSLPVPKHLPAYTRAVLYVFSNEGQLLLARDYPVALSAGR